MALKRVATHTDSDDEDDIFYYRFCSSSSSAQAQAQDQTKTITTAVGSASSSSLAPSKSTLYVSNLDYALTNSDLHTLFSTFGRIARVTVLKDRHTRLSRGVTFVQFVTREDACRAADQMHGKILNGRTLSASIALDNGHAPEFIRKHVYKDTGHCFECGQSGHLSYDCPSNRLGPCQRPPPKSGSRGGGGGMGRGGRGSRRREEDDNDDDDEGSDGGGGGAERFVDGSEF